MDASELRRLIAHTLAESRTAGPERDQDLAACLADRIQPAVPGPSWWARSPWGWAALIELVAAVLAAVAGLAGVVYAVRQFALATALYGYYPAGGHGRLVLALLGLLCIALSAGATAHVVFGLIHAFPLVLGSGVALILGAVFVAVYTGPSDSTLEYTQLIPAGTVALLAVSTAVLTVITLVAALAPRVPAIGRARRLAPHPAYGAGREGERDDSTAEAARS